MSPNAAGYLIHSEKSSGAKFSNRMEVARQVHAVHNPQRNQAEFVAFVARIMAITETRRKATSMARHHTGAALQQVLAQAWATKRKGVATQ